MQKMLDFLKKLDDPLVYGTALFLVGVAFIFLPAVYLDIPIAIAGAVIAVIGLILTLLPLGERDGGIISAFHMGLSIAKGGIITLIGVSLIIVRSGVSETVCDVLGIAVAVWCATKLFRPSHLFSERRISWYAETVTYVILAVGGLVILIFPLWPKVTAGCAILAVGAKLIYDGIRSRSSRRGDGKGNGTTRVSGGRDVYTSDFVDKSEDP